MGKCGSEWAHVDLAIDMNEKFGMLAV